MNLGNLVFPQILQDFSMRLNFGFPQRIIHHFHFIKGKPITITRTQGLKQRLLRGITGRIALKPGMIPSVAVYLFTPRLNLIPQTLPTVERLFDPVNFNDVCTDSENHDENYLL